MLHCSLGQSLNEKNRRPQKRADAQSLPSLIFNLPKARANYFGCGFLCRLVRVGSCLFARQALLSSTCLLPAASISFNSVHLDLLGDSAKAAMWLGANFREAEVELGLVFGVKSGKALAWLSTFPTFFVSVVLSPIWAGQSLAEFLKRRSRPHRTAFSFTSAVVLNAILSLRMCQGECTIMFFIIAAKSGGPLRHGKTPPYGVSRVYRFVMTNLR